MKKITIILFIAIAAFLTSCEGPMGPPGLSGEDGDSLIGTVFEITDDFTSQNDYRLIFDFPNDFEIYDTDVVLVYMLWEQSEGTDIWRLMPQTIVLKTEYENSAETDVLQYNFDYTVFDVQIFLEGTVDFSTLLPAEWQDQTFRIAVLPADFVALKSVDVSDINTILQYPDIKLNMNTKVELETIPKIELE